MGTRVSKPFRHLQCAARGAQKIENLAPKAWRIFGAKHRQNEKYVFLNLLKTWNQKSYRDNKEIVQAKDIERV